MQEGAILDWKLWILETVENGKKSLGVSLCESVESVITLSLAIKESSLFSAK